MLPPSTETLKSSAPDDTRKAKLTTSVLVFVVFVTPLIVLGLFIVKETNLVQMAEDAVQTEHESARLVTSPKFKKLNGTFSARVSVPLLQLFTTLTHDTGAQVAPKNQDRVIYQDLKEPGTNTNAKDTSGNQAKTSQLNLKQQEQDASSQNTRENQTEIERGSDMKKTQRFPTQVKTSQFLDRPGPPETDLKVSFEDLVSSDFNEEHVEPTVPLDLKQPQQKSSLQVDETNQLSPATQALQWLMQSVDKQRRTIKDAQKASTYETSTEYSGNTNTAGVGNDPMVAQTSEENGKQSHEKDRTPVLELKLIELGGKAAPDTMAARDPRVKVLTPQDVEDTAQTGLHAAQATEKRSKSPADDSKIAPNKKTELESSAAQAGSVNDQTEDTLIEGSQNKNQPITVSQNQNTTSQDARKEDMPIKDSQNKEISAAVTQDTDPKPHSGKDQRGCRLCRVVSDILNPLDMMTPFYKYLKHLRDDVKNTPKLSARLRPTGNGTRFQERKFTSLLGALKKQVAGPMKVQFWYSPRNRIAKVKVESAFVAGDMGKIPDVQPGNSLHGILSDEEPFGLPMSPNEGKLQAGENPMESVPQSKMPDEKPGDYPMDSIFRVEDLESLDGDIEASLEGSGQLLDAFPPVFGFRPGSLTRLRNTISTEKRSGAESLSGDRKNNRNGTKNEKKIRRPSPALLMTLLSKAFGPFVEGLLPVTHLPGLNNLPGLNKRLLDVAESDMDSNVLSTFAEAVRQLSSIQNTAIPKPPVRVQPRVSKIHKLPQYVSDNNKDQRLSVEKNSPSMLQQPSVAGNSVSRFHAMDVEKNKDGTLKPGDTDSNTLENPTLEESLTGLIEKPPQSHSQLESDAFQNQNPIQGDSDTHKSKTVPLSDTPSGFRVHADTNTGNSQTPGENPRPRKEPFVEKHFTSFLQHIFKDLPDPPPLNRDTWGSAHDLHTDMNNAGNDDNGHRTRHRRIRRRDDSLWSTEGVTMLLVPVSFKNQKIFTVLDHMYDLTERMSFSLFPPQSFFMVNNKGEVFLNKRGTAGRKFDFDLEAHMPDGTVRRQQVQVKFRRMQQMSLLHRRQVKVSKTPGALVFQFKVDPRSMVSGELHVDDVLDASDLFELDRFGRLMLPRNLSALTKDQYYVHVFSTEGLGTPVPTIRHFSLKVCLYDTDAPIIRQGDQVSNTKNAKTDDRVKGHDVTMVLASAFGSFTIAAVLVSCAVMLNRVVRGRRNTLLVLKGRWMQVRRWFKPMNTFTIATNTHTGVPTQAAPSRRASMDRSTCRTTEGVSSNTVNDTSRQMEGGKPTQKASSCVAKITSRDHPNMRLEENLRERKRGGRVEMAHIFTVTGSVEKMAPKLTQGLGERRNPAMDLSDLETEGIYECFPTTDTDQLIPTQKI